MINTKTLLKTIYRYFFSVNRNPCLKIGQNIPTILSDLDTELRLLCSIYSILFKAYIRKHRHYFHLHRRTNRLTLNIVEKLNGVVCVFVFNS